MDKTNIAKTWKSPKTEVRNSETEGYGFFAKEDIQKDEVLAIKHGHIVQTEEALKLDNEVGDYSLQISDDFYICPKSRDEFEDIVVFNNHSCDPNMGFDGQINYVAMRDIKAGEEICLDYAMALDYDYSLECLCGSENCRGTITGYDWKDEKLQEKYGSYFAWFIFKKFGLK